MKFGARLRSARTSARLTQADLAELTNIPQQTISKIERGDQESSSYVVQLALACGVSPQWLALGCGDMRGADQEQAATGNARRSGAGSNAINERGAPYRHRKDMSDRDMALMELARETGLTERFIEIAQRAMDAMDELIDKE